MLSLRAIRRKIRTVKNLQKITQAMKMVAAAKLKKVQGRVAASRPYAAKMRELVGAVAPHMSEDAHPLLARRKVQTQGIVVIAGDKGLCGGFNNGVLRRAVAQIDRHERTPVRLVTVGRKATEFFRRRGARVDMSFPLPGVNAGFADIQKISRAIAGWYERGEVDAVSIVYAVFVSTMVQRPEVMPFLPIEPPDTSRAVVPVKAGARARAEAAAAEVKARAAATRDYIFEPEAPRLLADLLPRFVDNQVYHLLLEAMASEQAARMTAMTQATENAGELVDTLTLDYNKARQWSITKELLDIVGGAEALRKAA